MVIRDVCPRWKSPQVKQNGHMHHGKPNHHCSACGRQWVRCCEPDLISHERQGLSKRFLLEGIVLRGMDRAVGGTRK
jgi:transposase-like protein